MFPDEVDSQTEDSSLHGGRIRSFKHERGNWASYVYFPCKAVTVYSKRPVNEAHVLISHLVPALLSVSSDHPEEEFGELLDGILSAACARGVVLTVQDEFHLSLSQTVVLRHHWIQPFTQSLKSSLTGCKRLFYVVFFKFIIMIWINYLLQ